MAVKKIYTVTDLGPGDGGKGGVVHKISHMTRAHTIIKVGGGQGSHGVRTSSGENFAFSHWGCGTFEGVRTHLTPRIVIIPEGILNEGDALIYQHGVHNAFDLLTVDDRALCATPYHGITSRLKEMALGGNPRGTIGTGVGEAYRDSLRVPELSIHACDLYREGLRNWLAAVRDEQIRKLEPIIQKGFLPDDQEEAAKEIALLRDDGFLDHIYKRFRETAARVQIVDHEYLEKEILARDGIVVVESSHGVLTDHFHGFHPHTSAIRTLPCFTREMLWQNDYRGDIVNIGVTRAYQIRHGAGPMPTTDPEMTESLLPGSHKENNRYQGDIRVGPLDTVLLRYALEVCGGPTAFDGLAVTWFDQIQKNGVWHVCESYQNADDRTYFTPEGNLKVRRGMDDAQLEYQEALGKQLFTCIPRIKTYNLQPDADRGQYYSLCANVLKEQLGIDVRMISFGPTELDKVFK